MQQFASFLPHGLKTNDLGDLGVIEFADLPFVPKRIYWIRDVGPSKSRGHHAHKKLRQYLVALQGSVEINLKLGSEEISLELQSDGNGLLLKTGVWRELRNFSSDAVLLVVCDQPYSEEDYIRNYEDYLEWFKNEI